MQKSHESKSDGYEGLFQYFTRRTVLILRCSVITAELYILVFHASEIVSVGTDSYYFSGASNSVTEPSLTSFVNIFIPRPSLLCVCCYFPTHFSFFFFLSILYFHVTMFRSLFYHNSLSLYIILLFISPSLSLSANFCADPHQPSDPTHTSESPAPHH